MADSDSDDTIIIEKQNNIEEAVKKALHDIRKKNKKKTWPVVLRT